MINKRRISWKKDRIFSLELKQGYYALLQMMGGNGHVAVFSCFRKDQDWGEIQLGPENVLFYCYLLNCVLKRTPVQVHKDISPAQGLEPPKDRIDGGSFRKVRFWEGTPHERELFMLGDPDLFLVHREFIDGRCVDTSEVLPKSDYEKVRHLELTNLRCYPEFNERLLLCAKRGENYDPLREVVFDQALEQDAVTYTEIISGVVPLSELGY